MSATAFSGTGVPDAVGTGRFSSVPRSRRALSTRLTRIGICRSDRENLARVLRQVAQRRDADGLADARDRHAELRGEVEARTDHDLGTRQVAVDARLAQLLQGAHFLDDLSRRALDQRRIIARQVDGDVAPVAAARLCSGS